MSVEEESTSCYCLLDPFACHVLLDSFGTFALTGEPITDCAVKQLKVAVFGCMSCNSLDYNLRVYCVDNTPCAFQVSLLKFSLWCRESMWFPRASVENSAEGPQKWTHTPGMMGIPISEQGLGYRMSSKALGSEDMRQLALKRREGLNYCI